LIWSTALIVEVGSASVVVVVEVVWAEADDIATLAPRPRVIVSALTARVIG
jgi:hypothetical protein